MNRKIIGMVVTVFVLAFTYPAVAQQQQKVPRIGFLVGSVSTSPARTEAFRQGLRDLGYVEGKNISIEWREDEGNSDRQRAMATELARLNLDAIVTVSSAQALAVKQATTTIPVVMISPGDPVGSGLVASLARPGGNLTGLTTLRPELTGKRLELLKEIVPKLSRVAVFTTLTGTDAALGFKELQAAGGPLGLKLHALDIVTAKDFEPAFQSALKERAEAAFVRVRGPVLSPNRKQFTALAAKSRLPVLYESAEEVEAGGLMSYGVNVPDLYRRAATYVDKILKGAKPADLPLEQPTKFELAVNLKAGQQIGVNIPEAMLRRADKVIK